MLSRQNRLLATLDDASFARLLPRLERLWMPSGLRLNAYGSLEYVYFPTSATVSIIHVMENGDSSAVASVGNEGLVGISLFLSGQSFSTLAIVHHAGNAYRIGASFVKSEFDLHGSFQHLALRYACAHMAQLAQNAACNRHHSTDQQLCYWLLLSLDRSGSNEVVITQELIAHMLGVHRERISAAVSRFQTEKIVQCGRGRIQVLDRARLERRACECYAAVKQEFAHLLSDGRADLSRMRV